MGPNFRDISYFLEVAQTKNISRAAERIGISQPSLTSAIQRLESYLDSSLLIRGRVGVELTSSGKAFLTHARALLQSWEQLKGHVNEHNEAMSGEYIIGCHASVGLYSLSQFLPELMQKHSQLNIKLEHGLSRHITEQVIQFNIDFGIVVNPIKHPDLVITPLFNDEVTFWVRKNSSSVQRSDSDNAVLICDLNLLQVQKLLSDVKRGKRSFKRLIPCTSLEIVAKLVSSGAGVGVLPGRVATNSGLKNLQPLKGHPTFKDEICLISRVDAQKTAAWKKIRSVITNSLARINES